MDFCEGDVSYVFALLTYVMVVFYNSSPAVLYHEDENEMTVSYGKLTMSMIDAS